MLQSLTRFSSRVRTRELLFVELSQAVRGARRQEEGPDARTDAARGVDQLAGRATSPKSVRPSGSA